MSKRKDSRTASGGSQRKTTELLTRATTTTTTTVFTTSVSGGVAATGNDISNSGSGVSSPSAGAPVAAAHPQQQQQQQSTSPAGRSVVSSPAVSAYDSRGAAMYICAVVSIYAAAVVLSVAVLAAVRRRRRRKSRDTVGYEEYYGAGEDAAAGRRKMARYLASVAKLRQMQTAAKSTTGNGIHRSAPLKQYGENDVINDYLFRSDKITGNGFQYAVGPKQVDVDVISDYLFRPDNMQARIQQTEMLAGNLTIPRRSSAGAASTAGRGRTSWGDGLGGRDERRVGCEDRSAFRPPRKKIFHGSLPSLGAAGKADRRRSGSGQETSGLVVPPAGPWTKNTAVTAAESVRSQPRGRGSPGDDVITLIQVTAPHSLNHYSGGNSRERDRTAMTSYPATVTSTPALPDSFDGYVNRCQWSTGCNGDIWVLQMETDENQPRPLDLELDRNSAHHRSANSALSCNNNNNNNSHFDAAVPESARKSSSADDTLRKRGVTQKDQQRASFLVDDVSPASAAESSSRNSSSETNSSAKLRAAIEAGLYSTDLIDLSVAHVIQFCREPPWNRLQRSSNADSEQLWFPEVASSSTRGSGSGRGAAYSKLVPEPPSGADNDGSCYSTSRESSLTSPAEAQRLLHVTSV